MLYAVLAPFFLCWSAIFGTRSQQAAGTYAAFVGRTVVGLVLLGAYAFSFGQGFRGAGLAWMIGGGVLGLGFGDLCLFSAYAHLGPRMTLLIWQCLAAPLAGLIEWLWLGTLPGVTELVATAIILSGVGIVLGAPAHVHGATPVRKAAGVLFGVGAALGQALGVVFSRHAYALNAASHLPVDGLTAAFQRVCGGMIVALFILIWRRKSIFHGHREKRLWVTASYMLANGFSGPFLGMGSYQAALLTLPSVIVAAMAATAPIMVIPINWWMNKDRLSVRVVLGSAVAVAGLIALVYLGSASR